LAAGLVLAAACASAPVSAPRSFLARFEAARAFVPDGMTSFWWNTQPLGMAALDAAAVELRCGRNHQPSEFPFVGGAFDGVTIEDFGVVGVSAARYRELGEPRATADGLPIWFTPANPISATQYVDQPEQWTTIVDGRFVVTANGEGLLREALRRPAGACFDDVLAVVDPRPNTAGVVCRQLPDQPEPIALVLTNSPVCFEFWSGDAPQAPALFEHWQVKWHERRGRFDAWTHASDPSDATAQAADFAGANLMLVAFFGIAFWI
jgi:hypothetical protein